MTISVVSERAAGGFFIPFTVKAYVGPDYRLEHSTLILVSLTLVQTGLLEKPSKATQLRDDSSVAPIVGSKSMKIDEVVEIGVARFKVN